MTPLAAHLNFSAYGFWLPNDPRGSGSNYVGARHLLPFGRATGLTDRSQSVASAPHDYALRAAAKRALLRPAVQFDDAQRQAIGDGFANYVRSANLTVWACAIMPDHVHLVVAKHRLDFEKLIGKLKSEATRELCKTGRHPFQHIEAETGEHHTCWGERGRTAFLFSEEAIAACIRYVEENPRKSGMPRQSWPFVLSFPNIRK